MEGLCIKLGPLVDSLPKQGNDEICQVRKNAPLKTDTPDPHRIYCLNLHNPYDLITPRDINTKERLSS